MAWQIAPESPNVEITYKRRNLKIHHLLNCLDLLLFQKNKNCHTGDLHKMSVSVSLSFLEPLNPWVESVFGVDVGS